MTPVWSGWMTEYDRAAQIDELVRRLPDALAERLYGVIAPAEARGDGTRAVAHALVAKLNGSRPAAIRRLFTGLFEAFLTRETRLLGAAGPGGAGLLTPLDVGALWSVVADRDGALSGSAEVLRLQALCADRLVSRVLATDEALALQDRMRRETARALAAALASPAALRSLLDRLTAWRAKEAARTRLGVEPRPLTRDDIALLLALLENHQEAAGAMERVARTVAGSYGRAQAPLRLADGLARVADEGAAARLALLVPITLANRHRAYAAAAAFLPGADREGQEALVATLVRHLGVVCGLLGDGASALARADRPFRGPALLPAEARAALDGDLDRLDRLLAVLEEYGVLEHERFGAAARDRLGDMIRRFETELYPFLLDRVAAACGPRRTAAEAEPLEWMLGFCMRWRDVLRRGLHWGTRFTDFRERVTEMLREAFRQSFAQGTPRPAANRLAEAARFAALAARLGEDTGSWITLLDQGVVRTVLERLHDAAPLSPAEEGLACAVLSLARAELKRTRHWRDATLVELDRLAGGRVAA